MMGAQLPKWLHSTFVFPIKDRHKNRYASAKKSPLCLKAFDSSNYRYAQHPLVHVLLP